MGSKRALAPRIASEIHARFPDSIVVDAFAGTCAIGTALSAGHPIIANDIHAFAETVARALLVTPAAKPTLADALRELKPAYDRNVAALSERIGDRLACEKRALSGIQRPQGWRKLLDFTLEELEAKVPLSIGNLPPLSTYRANHQTEPYALCSLLFASAYFGIRQSVEIDSLRYAIDAAPPERRDYYLLALLHAVSHCSTSPGHFAQYLVPRDEKNTRYIARMRGRSVFSRFLNELANLTIPTCHNRAANAAHRREATEFIQNIVPDLVGPVIIYVDPPYSRAQYSRYYHVLESLVLYDYPEAHGKGRYRTGRFTTNFSRAAKVGAAMQDLVQAAAATGWPLYFSYPQNGLLYKKDGNLRDLLGAHYPNVSIVANVTLAHSTMGGAPGSGTLQVREEVFCAHW